MKRSLFKRFGNVVKSIVVIITIGVLCAPRLLVNAGERTIVTGMVETSLLDNGNITSVKLNLKLDKDEIFSIVLNENGKNLGKEMNGNWVEVIGTVFIEDGVNWLEVKSYKKADYFE